MRSIEVECPDCGALHVSQEQVWWQAAAIASCVTALLPAFES